MNFFYYYFIYERIIESYHRLIELQNIFIQKAGCGLCVTKSQQKYSFENFKAVARKFRASSTYLIVYALVHYYSKETTNLPQPLATEYIDRRYIQTLYIYIYTHIVPHLSRLFLSISRNCLNKKFLTIIITTKIHEIEFITIIRNWSTYIILVDILEQYYSKLAKIQDPFLYASVLSIILKYDMRYGSSWVIKFSYILEYFETFLSMKNSKFK